MRREVEIRNREGIHARPAAEIVRCLRRHRVVMTIRRVEDNRRFFADSILDLLSANLGCGKRVVLEANGPDAERALDAVEGLLDADSGQAEKTPPERARRPQTGCAGTKTDLIAPGN